MIHRLACVLVVFASSGLPARAGGPCEVLFVAKGHVNPVNDGSSWDSAFCNSTALADALDAASDRMAEADAPPCIDIWVAAGVYKPSDSGASFALQDKVNLYGGFKVDDDFSMRRTGCTGGDDPGRPCETSDDCPGGGTCDTERVAIISGDINDDDGAPCQVDADCGAANFCIGGRCLIVPNFGPLVTYAQAGNPTLDGLVLRFGHGAQGSVIRIIGQAGECPLKGPTLRNCLIRNSYTPSNQGGAVNAKDAGVNLGDCVFLGNEADDEGGALRSEDGDLHIIGSVFAANRSRADTSYGGAMFLDRRTDFLDCPDPATPTIEQSTFDRNTAGKANGGWGGAIATHDSLIILASTFMENHATYVGAVYGFSDLAFTQRHLEIEGCQFVRNVGGVASIRAWGGMKIRNSVFIENEGGYVGGVMGFNLEIDSCEFSRNTGPEGVAAVHADGQFATISRCRFNENYGSLGSLYAQGVQAAVSVVGCEFVNNSGSSAGAATFYGRLNATVSDVLFAGNTIHPDALYRYASAVFQKDAGVVYQDSRFVGNRDGMGTIAVDHSDATFSNTIFAGNQAPAMIFQLEGVVANITNCTIVKNTSLADRGAMTAWFLHKPDSTLNILNSIVWDNDDADSSPECTDQIQCGQECACENCAVDSPCFTCGPHISVQVSHSNIQHPSCVWPGVGNINQDPQFVRNDTPRDCDGNGWGDPQCSAGPCAPGVTGCDDYGDFRLRPGSPAINAGDPNAADLPATDLDGNPRVAGCPDIGAYEYLGGGECCTDEDCGQTEICCANVCTANVDTDADTVADCLDLCPGEDDTIDADQNGTPDCAQFHAIPAASTWGMAVLALGLLILAKTRWRRRGATN